MCDNEMCEHPKCAVCESGKTHEQLRDELVGVILEHGHQVRYIFPDVGDDDPPFFYTVGRSVWGKPELLLTGPLPSAVGQFVLNEAARLQDAGEITIADGVEIPANVLLANYPCRVTRCDPVAAEMSGATAIASDDVESYQLVWPDMEGNFPGDPDYDDRLNQPVFTLLED